MKGWTMPELRKVRELYADPSNRGRIAKAYKQWAIANGFPARSSASIHQAAVNNKLRSKPCLTLAQIADRLEMSCHRISYLQEQGLLDRRDVKGSLIGILMSQPNRLAGCNRQALLEWIGKDHQALVNRVPACVRDSRSRPVVCSKTGRYFHSVQAAAEFAGITASTLSHHLHSKSSNQWWRPA